MLPACGLCSGARIAAGLAWCTHFWWQELVKVQQTDFGDMQYLRDTVLLQMHAYRSKMPSGHLRCQQARSLTTRRDLRVSCKVNPQPDAVTNRTRLPMDAHLPVSVHWQRVPLWTWPL
jgi:hypothetical protein